MAQKLDVTCFLGSISIPVGVPKYHFLKKVVEFTLLVAQFPFQIDLVFLG